MQRIFRGFTVAILMLAAAAGCGGMDRRPVFGSITIDSKPLASGMIEFEPPDGDGLSSGAVVTAGSYAIEGKRGLPPGRYVVRIHAAEAAEPRTVTGAPGDIFLPPGRDLIPARYNRSSELFVDVTPGGDGRQEDRKSVV